MDLAHKKTRLVDIKKKYEPFVAWSVYYDQIHCKLEEVKTDLREVDSIRKWLNINGGGHTESEAVLFLVDDVESLLEDTVEGLNERMEFLEFMKKSLEDDETDEEYFERTYCSPHLSSSDDDE